MEVEKDVILYEDENCNGRSASITDDLVDVFKYDMNVFKSMRVSTVD